MISNSSSKDLKAVIIGSTGAIGKEVINYMLSSNNWSKILIVCRKKLLEWDNLPSNKKLKIEIIVIDNLNLLSQSKEDIIKYNSLLNLENFNSVFCCLGSRVSKGEEEFKKVDYEYVLNSLELCTKFSIPHFTYVSSKGSNHKSFFLYLRTKGQLEEKIKNICSNLNSNNCQNLYPKTISIFKPGAILNRDNDFRIGELFLKGLVFMSFKTIDHIEAKDLGIAMVKDAENKYSLNYKCIDNLSFYNNSDIKKI